MAVVDIGVPLAKGKQAWRVWSLDVWGNETDGYEVNDSFRTNCVFACNEDDSDITVIRKCFRALYPEHNKRIWERTWTLDGDDMIIHIEHKGKPVVRLEREDC